MVMIMNQRHAIDDRNENEVFPISTTHFVHVFMWLTSCEGTIIVQEKSDLPFLTLQMGITSFQATTLPFCKSTMIELAG
jgi:hypothetical protein